MQLTAPRLVALTLAIGFALTGVGGALLFSEARSLDQQRHERLTSRIRDTLRSRIAVYTYGLRGGRGVFAASEDVTREEFRDYASTRDPAFEFPGAIGVGFIRRVPKSELPAFLASRQSSAPEGLPGFALKAVQGQAPPVPGPNAFIIDYIEPLEFNRDAVGYDIATELHRFQAATRAAETGEATLTAPVTLVQAPDEGPGYLYLLPVFAPGPLPLTPESRAQALIGWVYMPLVMRRIAHGIGEVADGELDFEVFDGTPENGTLVYDDDRHLQHTTPDGSVTSPNHAYGDRELVRRERIALGGREWTLVASTTPRFVHASRLSAWLVVVGGGAFAIVLAWLVYTLAAPAPAPSASPRA